MIDLQQFCGITNGRYYLCKPFSYGEYTYATNGHIIVRIARCAEFGENDNKTTQWDEPFKYHDIAEFRKVDDLVLPPVVPPEEGDCSDCNGRGYEHDCPDCHCTCEKCGGTGIEIAEAKVSTTLSGSIFNLRYVRIIAALPSIEIATTNFGLFGPLAFRFDSGIGALMPLRRRYEEHIEVERTFAEIVTG